MQEPGLLGDLHVPVQSRVALAPGLRAAWPGCSHPAAPPTKGRIASLAPRPPSLGKLHFLCFSKLCRGSGNRFLELPSRGVGWPESLSLAGETRTLLTCHSPRDGEAPGLLWGERWLRGGSRGGGPGGPGMASCAGMRGWRLSPMSPAPPTSAQTPRHTSHTQAHKPLL